MIREAFKVRGSKYLIVSKDGKAHWSLEPSLWSACVSVDNSKLVEWTNYLIDNVYIKVGSKVYRQTVGIPMGTDCAPQLANLFLFHEYSYMKILMKKNLCVAKKFNDTIRYIDDLLTVNISKFEKKRYMYVTFTLLNLHLKELVNLREICPIWTYQLVYVVVNM